MNTINEVKRLKSMCVPYLTCNDVIEATGSKALLVTEGALTSPNDLGAVCVICAPRKPFAMFAFAMRVICDCLRICA